MSDAFSSYKLDEPPSNHIYTLSLATVLLIVVTSGVLQFTAHHALASSGVIVVVIVAFMLSLTGSVLLLRACWHMRLNSYGHLKFVFAALVLAVPTVLITIETFAGFLALLWERRAPSDIPLEGSKLWLAEQHFARVLVDAIPLISVAETLGWQAPLVPDDTFSGILTLVFKVLLVVPLFGFFVGAYQLLQEYRSRHPTEIISEDHLPRYESTQTLVETLVEIPGHLLYGLILLRYPIIIFGVLTLLVSPSSPTIAWLMNTISGRRILEIELSFSALPFIIQTVGIITIVMVVVWARLVYRISLYWAFWHMGGNWRTSASIIWRRLVLFCADLQLAVALTLWLHTLGIARSEPKAEPAHQTEASFVWYLQNIADVVPFLEIPQTLNWSIEYEFVDIWSRVFMLILKVSLVLLLILPVTFLLKLYEELDPRRDSSEYIPMLQEHIFDLERQPVVGADLVLARNQLALLYAINGDFSWSIKQFERALADAVKHYGKGHKYTVDIQESLESVRRDAAKREEE